MEEIIQCYKNGRRWYQDLVNTAVYCNKLILYKIRNQEDTTEQLEQLKKLIDFATDYYRRESNQVIKNFAINYRKLPPEIKTAYPCSTIGLEEFSEKDKVLVLLDPSTAKLVVNAVVFPEELATWCRIKSAINPVTRAALLFADPANLKWLFYPENSV
jgi:hypothetical protein